MGDASIDVIVMASLRSRSSYPMSADPLYRIRSLRDGELNLLLAIEQAAGVLFRGTSEDWIVDDDGRGLDSYEAWRQTGHILVAVDEADVPVGFAAVGPLDGQGYLHEIDVHPEHGQRGLGRRLVEAACDWAREQGFTQIQLSTFRHIPWNAPFYARLGFRELADSELGPDLLAERRHEADAGLDMTKRMFMRRELDA